MSMQPASAPCPHCHTPIDPRSETCPSCLTSLPSGWARPAAPASAGEPSPIQPGSVVGVKVLGVLLLVVGILFLVGWLAARQLGGWFKDRLTDAAGAEEESVAGEAAEPAAGADGEPAPSPRAPATPRRASKRAAGNVDDAEALRQTMTDMRDVGTAMMSWLTDEVGAGAAGQPAVALADTPRLPRGALTTLLVPDYIDEVPRTDGWGHEYEYGLDFENPLAEQAMYIRSPGRDGRFEADPYVKGAFAEDDYDRDIVWVDGLFVAWPGDPNRP